MGSKTGVHGAGVHSVSCPAEGADQAVEHPEWYTEGGIETIDYIIAKGWGWGYCIGNAIKYLSRAGRKSKETTKQDLLKAIQYIRYAIEIVNNEN